MKINQVASLLGSTSVLFRGLISHNMEILPNFQVVAVVTAFLAATSLYSGMFHMRHFECKRNPKEAFLSESEQELAWTSTILPMRQILSQRNFHLFLIVNFFQVFHLTTFSNFMMIMMRASFPPRLSLLPQGASCMGLASSALRSPLSLMVFGISALFTRPSQSLAPMLILSKLTQYGYGEPNNRILLDLQETMFSLVCVVPLGIAMVQILTWSSFSVRNRADYSGTV